MASFTRHRTLSFPIVVVFLLNLIKGALQRELDQFFQVLSPGDVAERVVTKSAFCAARQKLKPTAFIELCSATIWGSWPLLVIVVSETEVAVHRCDNREGARAVPAIVSHTAPGLVTRLHLG